MIIPINSLVESLAEAIDLVSSQVNNHHRRVASIASYIGAEAGLPHNRQENLIIASALHDVGGLTSRDRLDLLTFEQNSGNHTEYGYMLLRKFKPFAHLAPIVRYHHAYWMNDAVKGLMGEPIPLESRIIFLADRIAVLMPEGFTLNDVGPITEKIEESSGRLFSPELVDIFLKNLAKKECFWLDARDAFIRPMLRDSLARNLNLDDTDLLSLGKLYSQVIDFRSSFTSTHSSGVSVVAEELAKNSGFSAEECLHMRLAGYLHDIGKLVVPESILEKEGALSKDEYAIMRSHTYYTDRLLLGIDAFDKVRVWAAMHHERLNGEGYPFHLKASQLSLGSRIMAVADVFVAIREDRPYRAGMRDEAALNVLNTMVNSGALDGDIVEVLKKHYDKIDGKRLKEQLGAREEYNEFYRQKIG